MFDLLEDDLKAMEDALYSLLMEDDKINKECSA